MLLLDLFKFICMISHQFLDSFLMLSLDHLLLLFEILLSDADLVVLFLELTQLGVLFSSPVA